MTYTHRKHAGIVLAALLKDYAHRTDVIVFALPRGGVPVAYEIATRLSVPLDVLIVRKLGVPQHEELAMGAIASGGIVIINHEMVQALHLSSTSIQAVQEAEQLELIRREHLYRGHRAFPTLHGKTIILVDDGIATGATITVAIQALQQQSPSEIIVAVPVAERSTCKAIRPLVKTLICPLQPVAFHAVSVWYEDFPQTTDEEVIALLDDAQLALHLVKFHDNF